MEKNDNETITVLEETDGINDAMADEELDEKAARKARQMARRLERRHKRNARIARCRTLKNFFIWLLGVLFLPIALAASMFIVPVGLINSTAGKTIIGGQVYVGSEEDYEDHKDASDEANADYYKDISKFSIVELFRYFSGNGLNYTKFENFPVVIDLLNDLEEKEVMEGTAFKDIVKIDIETFKTVALGDQNAGEKITGCLKIVATLATLMDEESAADFKDFLFGEGRLFGRYSDPEIQIKLADTENKINRKALYYKNAEDGKFYRAFDDDGKLVSELQSAAVNATLDLYYPPLSEVTLSELPDVFTDIVEQMPVEDLFSAFGFEEKEEPNPADYEGGVNSAAYIKALEEYENSSEEGKVAPNPADYEGGAENEIYKEKLSDYKKNRKFWNILKQATGTPEDEDVSMKDLSSDFDSDKIKLATVLDPTEGNNAKLYDILRDAMEIVVTDDDLTEEQKLLSEEEKAIIKKDIANNKITIADFRTFEPRNIHIQTVLNEDDVADNDMLAPLYEDNPAIGGLSDAINNMQVSRIFEDNCFTTDVTLAVDTDSKYYHFTYTYETVEDEQIVEKTVTGYTMHTSLSGHPGAVDTSKVYYINGSKENGNRPASVWLFMYYTWDSDSSNLDNGSVITYKNSDLMFKDMKDEGMDSISRAFTDATIRQLVQAGIIADSLGAQLKYEYSIQGIIG